MIKFFRRVRQRLLTENKFSKYLIYAIGEIILVVIGILIALQINNRNESQKDKKQEQDYYCLLLDDLNQDKQQVETLKILVQERLEYSNRLIFVIQQDLSNATEFGKNLRYAIRLGAKSFQPNDATYQDIKSSGNLSIIKDKKIIKALNTYFKTTDGYTKAILKNVEMDFDRLSNIESFLSIGLFNANEEFYKDQIFTEEIRKQLSEDLPQFISEDIKPNLYSTALSIGLNNRRRSELLSLIENEVDLMLNTLDKKCIAND